MARSKRLSDTAEIGLPGRCPLHAEAQWRELQPDADEWHEIVAYDEEIRCGIKGGAYEAFLHRSLVPIDDVDFRTAEERGQQNFFLNECDGLCGT
jgi:hypothetical protein